MRIVFNMTNLGLANNGGCQTILLQSMALKDLGHDVKIITNKNNFTWFDIPDDLVTITSNDQWTWPDCDIIIATACSTAVSTEAFKRLPINRKFYWMRAHETWAMNEMNLIARYKLGLRMLVNSEWQKLLLHTYGIHSEIQYTGLPINEMLKIYVDKKLSDRKNGKEKRNVIGALYSSKSRKRFEDVIDICNKAFEGNYINHLILFGDEDLSDRAKASLLVHYDYFKQPNLKQKVELLAGCDIWLATTDNEGLHIPPMEAGICNNNLVVRGLPSSGMSDYALHNVTAKTFFFNDEAVQEIGEYVNNTNECDQHKRNLNYVLFDKINTVEINAKKFEKKLLSAMEE